MNNSLLITSPISQETMAKSWLVAVESHGKTGSTESQKTLSELDKNLPDFSFASEEIQEDVQKIHELLQSKNWAPDLSPKTSKVLKKMCEEYSLKSKPSCAMKLDFT